MQRSSSSAPRIPAGATAQLALMLGAFAAGTAVAALAGAGLGTACAFGQMAFAIALVTVLMWAP